MATLATLWDRLIGVRVGAHAETHVEGLTLESPYRVRPLPNEHICLWIKSVDNSRVEAKGDPRVRDVCWHFASVAAVIVLVILGIVLPNVYNLLADYQIHELKQERQMLLDERQALQVEEARLLSPRRLEEVAQRQKFAAPAPPNVVYLQPAAEGELALNLRKR